MKAKRRKATQRTSLGPLAGAALRDYENAYEALTAGGRGDITTPDEIHSGLQWVWDRDDETDAHHIRAAIAKLDDDLCGHLEDALIFHELRKFKEKRAAVSEARRKAGKLGAKASRRTKLADPQVAAIMREVRRKLNDNANKLSANAIIRQVSRSHKGDNGLPIMSEAAIKKRLQRGRKEKRGKYKRETRPKK